VAGVDLDEGVVGVDLGENVAASVDVATLEAESCEAAAVS
jgi:hypothetical protein